MGDKVLISYSKLGGLISELTNVIEELRNAGDRSSALSDSIANPYFRTEFRNAAVDSESRWSTKRGRLADDLEGVLERAQGIKEQFEQFDEEAAANFEAEQTA